jgi:hypothetical protein
MGTTRTEYSAPFPHADLIQRDQGATLTCPVERNDALVTPTAGTFTLRKPDGTALIDAQAVTIPSDTAQYAVSSASIADEPYRGGYIAEWTLTVAGSSRSFRNEVQIVRHVPSQPANQAALEARHTTLTRDLAGTGETTLQKWLDEAMRQMTRWLIQKGNRPNLIVQSSDLFDLYVAWTLRLYFYDLSQLADPNGHRRQLADDYKAELEQLKNTISFAYAPNDTTTPEGRRRAARPQTFLGTSGWPDYDWRWR